MENRHASFEDAPRMEQVEATIDSWQRRRLPERLERLVSTSGEGGMIEVARLVSKSLSEIQSVGYKSRLEVKVISWLYDFIRINIKRGRVFDLGEVLLRGHADCFGYSKLFTLLGRLLSLNVGILEVVVDNAGRYVPHTACLVKLSDGGLRFVDLWYGSTNIKHKRLGLQVKRGDVWSVEDLEMRELGNMEEVCYLPDSCVDAITLYIRGNRHLERQEFDAAIECYSKAIGLYPGNARLFYNRAIAYENLSEYKRANADYTQALGDDAAVTRVLATEHDAVISLLDLDARGIDNLAQEIYLLRKGFLTGREVALAGVARKFGLSETETRTILSRVEAELSAYREIVY